MQLLKAFLRMATDFTSEIVALKAAIASGATEVRDGDRVVRYDSLTALWARLRWLENQTAGASASNGAGFGAFDRGDE